MGLDSSQPAALDLLRIIASLGNLGGTAVKSVLPQECANSGHVSVSNLSGHILLGQCGGVRGLDPGPARLTWGKVLLCWIVFNAQMLLYNGIVGGPL